MMPLDHPELTEYTLEGVKSYAADGARDVLIVMSSVSEGDYVVPRKSGELTKRDKEKLASEGIPDRSWDNDADLMKERYRKDRKSESVVVAEHCHLKKSVIAKISSTLNNTTKPVVVLHYIGSGRLATGDWCFCDGYISFRDIADLYIQHFTGRVLYIISDCSYSGKWVESCKEFLFDIGVQPCGHSARKKGIKLKVYSSCQADQIGSSLIYSARGNGNDEITGTKYTENNFSVAPDQTTCAVDFTKIICGNTPEEECALIPTFTFHDKASMTRIHIVRGNDKKGKPAWHCVLLIDDPETFHRFEENQKMGRKVDLNDYGLIIKSGRGQEPPQQVQDWIERIKNGIERLQLH